MPSQDVRRLRSERALLRLRHADPTRPDRVRVPGGRPGHRPLPPRLRHAMGDGTAAARLGEARRHVVLLHHGQAARRTSWSQPARRAMLAPPRRPRGRACAWGCTRTAARSPLARLVVGDRPHRHRHVAPWLHGEPGRARCRALDRRFFHGRGGHEPIAAAGAAQETTLWRAVQRAARAMRDHARQRPCRLLSERR